MASLTLEECYAHADRLKDRVVVITGAGSGFGRQLAQVFAKYGAKLVLGDVDMPGLQGTVDLVEKSFGKVAISAKCDVTNWDDQIALFAAGFKAWGAIDIVLPNAGVNEIGRFDQRLEDGPQDKPTKPNLKTLEIDLIGVLYTTRIAMWYFGADERDEPGLRTICFTASMSTFYGANMGPMYGASKAGILGILKGILDSCRSLDARAVAVAPYFTKTALLGADFAHPHPEKGYCKMEDVIGAFVVSITDPEPAHDYSCWIIPDDIGVFRMKSTGMLLGAEGARRPKGDKAKL